MRPHPKKVRYVDADYLAFVRQKTCVIGFGCQGVTDPDHLITRGAGGSDLYAFSICRGHHTERHLKGTEEFEKKYQIQLWRCVAELMHEYFGGKNGAD